MTLSKREQLQDSYIDSLKEITARYENKHPLITFDELMANYYRLTAQLKADLKALEEE